MVKDHARPSAKDEATRTTIATMGGPSALPAPRPTFADRRAAILRINHLGPGASASSSSAPTARPHARGAYRQKHTRGQASPRTHSEPPEETPRRHGGFTCVSPYYEVRGNKITLRASDGDRTNVPPAEPYVVGTDGRVCSFERVWPSERPAKMWKRKIGRYLARVVFERGQEREWLSLCGLLTFVGERARAYSSDLSGRAHLGALEMAGGVYALGEEDQQARRRRRLRRPTGLLSVWYAPPNTRVLFPAFA